MRREYTRSGELKEQSVSKRNSHHQPLTILEVEVVGVVEEEEEAEEENSSPRRT